MKDKKEKCEECGGKVEVKKKIPVRVGCKNMSPAYPCEKCGRLH